MRKFIILVALVGAMLMAMASVASAHVIVVTNASGTHSQFLGGPGNPGHAGHHGGPSGNGHLAACESVELQGNGTVDFVDDHFGSCVFP